MPFDVSTKRHAKSLLSPEGASWSSANNNGILFKNVQTQTYDKIQTFNLCTTTEPEEILFNHNTQMHYDCHLGDCSKSTSEPVLTVMIIQNWLVVLNNIW
jgi:hypothetical protein